MGSFRLMLKDGSMKNFPTHLKIGDADYCLHFVNELDEELAGICNDHQKLIVVSPNQSVEEIHCTLLHEILHAIEKEYKLTLGHKIIRKLEVALAQVNDQLYMTRSRRK